MMRATETKERSINDRSWRWAYLGVALLWCGGAAAQGEAPGLTPQIFDAVVALHAEIPATARTAPYLGTEREGAGIVIDGDGLVVTIGYLVTEATAIELTPTNGKPVSATLVGLDNDSGLALVRAALPLGVKPLPLGRSESLAESAPVLILGAGGPEAAQGARVVSRRPFAGYWEYLLDNAIFTAPPHPAWSGAALVGADGKLLGVGSLVVHDAAPGTALSGNMFVPVDLLKAAMGDLLASGRPGTPPRPWLGVNLQEHDGKLVVIRVSEEGPAQQAGLARGSIVTAVAGRTVGDLAQFYRAVWALGAAGVEVPLTVRQDGAERDINVKSIDRYKYLKLDTTY
jgi:S1-C subfamily serine protease